MRRNLTMGALVAVLLALATILLPIEAQTPLRPGAVCKAGQYIYYDTTGAQWRCSDTALLTSFSGVTATAAEVNKLAGVTAGTVTASKAVVVNGSRRVDYLDIVAPYLNGTAVTATAAELNKLASVTAGTVSASKAVVVDASKQVDYWDILTTFKIGGTAVTATAAELNRAAGITPGTATASKLLAVDADADITAGLRNVVASGDMKAATFHVGADAGVDKACTAADAILTIKKGIVTAVTCTTAGPLPTPDQLAQAVESLRQEVVALRAQVQSGGPR